MVQDTSSLPYLFFQDKYFHVTLLQRDHYLEIRFEDHLRIGCPLSNRFYYFQDLMSKNYLIS